MTYSCPEETIRTLWDKRPQGLTLKVIERAFRCDEAEARQHVSHMLERGARWIRRPDKRRPSGWLVPRDWQEPQWDMTTKQRAVLEYLSSRADKNGIARVSKRRICREVGLSKGGNFTALFASMEIRGYLHLLDPGVGTIEALWQTYPDGNGPRRFTNERTDHGRN